MLVIHYRFKNIPFLNFLSKCTIHILFDEILQIIFVIAYKSKLQFVNVIPFDDLREYYFFSYIMKIFICLYLNQMELFDKKYI